jgi:hypothetical protein
LTVIVAIVWFANGLFCKEKNLVPRYQEIIAGILGDECLMSITVITGSSEILMAV